MISCSSNPAIERAQPWLGTLVTIRVTGLAECDAHRAIDAAFQQIAEVHRLMSFHHPGSDLTRLNNAAPGEPVEVHPYTYEVFREAGEVSSISRGSFDVTVGAELVEWELLPDTGKHREAHGACWRDVELLPGNRIVAHRPLCVDLGGIAKGFAVDRAIEALRSCGAKQTVVNAGGDIRVEGNTTELIRLGMESSLAQVPVLELVDGSVASSSGQLQSRLRQGPLRGPHVDGVRRLPAPTNRFVAVVTNLCVIADALTKVVMAGGAGSAAVLQHFGASAYLHDPGRGWQHLRAAGPPTE